MADFSSSNIDLPGDVTFGICSAALSPYYASLLQQAAAQLLENPSVVADIFGYTDIRGTRQDNQTLSEQRANSVADYLVSRGVSPRRLTRVGKGESTTYDKLAINRRVEIRLRDS